MNVERRLEVMEQENDMLRERVRVLQDALSGTESPIPFTWGLTRQESIVFGVLVNRTLATKEAISAALYGNLGKEAAEVKIVDVFVCKMRKKLRPFGVEIKTVWGQGYTLPDVERAKFRRAA